MNRTSYKIFKTPAGLLPYRSFPLSYTFYMGEVHPFYNGSIMKENL